MHVRTTISGSTYQEENDELMSLSLDLLDEKREAAPLGLQGLHGLLWAYRTTPKTATQETP